MSVNEIVQLGEHPTVIENSNLKMFSVVRTEVSVIFLLNSLVINSIEIAQLGEHQTEGLKVPGLNPDSRMSSD